PENSKAPRFLSPPTTTATADFVAVVARAARAFEPYDAALAASYVEAAQRGWDYLVATPEDTTPPQGSPVRTRFTGGYWNTDVDDRFWAAAEMWETTGDAEVLADLEARAATARPGTYWDWPDMSNLAAYTYLLSGREGRDAERVAQLIEAISGQVQTVHAAAQAHPYGSPLGYRYIWGSNGIAARTAMSIAVLRAVDPEAVPESANTISATMDHLLGRNYYGRSYVTGLGYYPPRAPHHRPSQADAAIEPWPGLLVGGPEATGTSWVDAENDYRTNEIAINWNAAMIYAAASLLPQD
ncbi:MAG TPA: glycoside hydrolase family 9 protein, partial [Polyangiaceae bacterium]